MIKLPKPRRCVCIKALQRTTRVIDVNITGKTATVTFSDGCIIKRAIKFIKHYPIVAHWGRQSWEDSTGLKIDADMANNKHYLETVIVHEVAEERFWDTNSWKDSYTVRNAHAQSIRMEREYHIKMFGQDSYVKYKREVDQIANNADQYWREHPRTIPGFPKPNIRFLRRTEKRE